MGFSLSRRAGAASAAAAPTSTPAPAAASLPLNDMVTLGVAVWGVGKKALNHFVLKCHF